MRNPCACCARKHLAQAIALVIEFEQGYATHGWLAVGHMAEAEAETISKWPDVAADIRAARLQLQDHLNFGSTFDADLLELIDQLTGLYAEEIAATTGNESKPFVDNQQ